VVTARRLEAHDEAERDARILALTTVAGYRHVVVVRADSVTHLYPNDHLQAFMAGLNPRLISIHPVLAESLALDDAVDEALDQAEKRQAEATAATVDHIHVLVGARVDAVALRALFAVTQLENAGLALERRDSLPARPTLDDAAHARTPYESLLRVRAAKTWKTAWHQRRAEILPEVEPSRRQAIEAVFDPPPACAPNKNDRIVIDTPTDLLFAYTAIKAQKGEAPALVTRILDLLDDAHLAWAFSSLLVELRGHVAANSPMTTRINQHLLAQLSTLSGLMRTAPKRFMSFSALSIALLPATIDPPVRAALVDLAGEAAHRRLGAATEPSELLEGTMWSALALLVYPPDLRGASIQATVTTIKARLDGDLQSSRGWSMATLQLVDEVYRLVTGQPSAIDVTAPKVIRALSGEIKWPELARFAVAGTLYGWAALEDRLDPAQPSGEPRAALSEALLRLGGPGEAMSTSEANELAGFADTLLSGLSRLFRAPTRGAECKGHSVPDPQLAALLRRVNPMRQRLLARPASSVSALRVKLFVQLLSDALDAASPGSLHFTTSDDSAQKIIDRGLATTALEPYAAALGSGYVSLRGYLARDPERASVFSAESGIALLHGIEKAITRSSSPADVLLLGLDRLPAHPTGTFSQLSQSMAKTLFSAGRHDEADTWLLLAATDALFHESPPSPGLLSLAIAQRSRVAPLLVLVDDGYAHHQGRVPDAQRSRKLLRAAAEEGCLVDDAELTFVVRQSIEDFGNGRHKRARAELDHVLAELGRRPIEVPRLSLTYEQKPVASVFTLHLDATYASPFMRGFASFQLGIGWRSPGPREVRFVESLKHDKAEVRDTELARFATTTLAIDLVYALSDGDTKAIEELSGRLRDWLEGEIKLGKRTITSTQELGWDVQGLLAVAAVLAADRHLPLLSARLWMALDNSLATSSTDLELRKILDPAPSALETPALKSAVARARIGVAALGAIRPCTVERPKLTEPTCEQYPLVMSLWLAHATVMPPPIPAGCAVDPATPLLLTAATKPADPGSADTVERTVAALVGSNPAEAARFLERYRLRSPGLTALARRLAASPAVSESTRARLQKRVERE